MKWWVTGVLLTTLTACAHRPEVAPAGRMLQRLEEAESAAAEERHLEAARAYGEVLALDRTQLAAHRGRIKAYFNLGRIAELEDEYRVQLKRQPDDPFAAYGLALVRYATSASHAKEALSLLARAAAARTDEADFPYRTGLILLDAERYAAARDAFSRAVSLAPDETRFRIPYALALYHSGDHPRAREMLRGVLAGDPSAKQVEQARAVADRLSDPFADLPPSTRERVDQAIGWLEKADVPQNAIDLLRDVLLEYPDAAIVHALLGLSYERIGNGGEAMVHLRRSVELAPDLPQPRLYLGSFLYGKQRPDEARVEYLAALERNPLYLEAHIMLARMGMERGDGPGAIEHLEAWRLLAPSDPQPRLDLARARAAAGDLDGAQAALDEALALDSGNLEAHLSLGALHLRRRATARDEASRKAASKTAKQHLQTVLDAQPDNTAAQRLMEELERPGR